MNNRKKNLLHATEGRKRIALVRDKAGRGIAPDRRGPKPQGGRGDFKRNPRQSGKARGRRPGSPGSRGPRRDLPPLPNLKVNLVPEEKGVDSLARQIRFTGRAYPMFDIAHLLLKKPERFHVQFQSPKSPTNSPETPLWVCNIDETLWLKEQDALKHIFKKHFDTFYKTNKTPTDPPKGTYTFVAQCGMSGVILGPPNYHS